MERTDAQLETPFQRSEKFEDVPDHIARPQDQHTPTVPPPIESFTRAFVYHYRPRAKLRRLLVALIPSFLKPSGKASPKHGIAALDGLRGLACLFVFNEHYVICYQSRNSQHWINRVPFIRLWWHGKGAVYLFFVISGYVLSYKPLKQIRAKQFTAFQKTMSSSILRRGFRLYLPCLIVSFVMLVFTALGFYNWPAKMFEHYKEFLFLKEATPPTDRSVAGLLAMYWSNVKFIFCSTFPFDIAMSDWDYEEYDPHQWSIPVEFRGSMALFTVLVAQARMHTGFRLFSTALIFHYLYNTGRIHVSLFFGGLFCAEIDLLRQAYYDEYHKLPSPLQESPALAPTLRALHLEKQTYTMAWLATFVLGYFMISSVREIQDRGNWLPSVITGYVADPDVFLLTYGSIITVWSVANCPELGVIFLSPVVLYLGNISYALYLAHGTVIRGLGYLWLPATLRMATLTPWSKTLDKEWWEGVSNGQATLAHILGLMVVAPVTFWYADLLWVHVDVPVVKFARWVETKITCADEGT